MNVAAIREAGKINHRRLLQILDRCNLWKNNVEPMSVRQMVIAECGSDDVLAAWEVGWCLGGLACSCCDQMCECGCRLTCPTWALVVKEMARRRA